MPQIPAGWKETTLGEVCIVMSWSTPSTKEELYRDWDISWITPKDLSNYNERYIVEGERNITEAWVKNSSAQILPPNTILFSSRAPIWYVAIAKKELTTNQGFKNIICDEKESHYLFFYYWLKYRSEYIEKISSGSTFTEASAAIMRSLPIHLPPLPEQQAIAAVLSSFDDKIELLRAENQTLEQMGQELFKERFGKWKVGDELPEGWRVGKIENIFHFLEWPWIRNWQYTDSWTKFINIKLIQNHDILTNGANFVSNEEAYWRYKHFLLEERDFVLSTSWTLGRGAIVRRKHLPLMLNTSVIRFRPLDKKSYWFMYLYLSSKVFIHQLESMASWSVQLNFWPMHLKQINLIIPNNSMIDQFCNITNNLFEKIINNLDQIDELSATRDLLLPKLMSGEVRVKI